MNQRTDELITFEDVDAYVRSLFAKQTPWASGCATVLQKLWVEVSAARQPPAATGATTETDAVQFDRFPDDSEVETHMVVDADFARQLERERDDARRELAVSDKLLEERNRVLKAIPGCDAHGDQCVPHALEWIAARLSSTGAPVAWLKKNSFWKEIIITAELLAEQPDYVKVAWKDAVPLYAAPQSAVGVLPPYVAAADSLHTERYDRRAAASQTVSARTRQVSVSKHCGTCADVIEKLSAPTGDTGSKG